MKKILCIILALLTLTMCSCGIIIINDREGSITTTADETEPNNFGDIVTATPEPNIDDGYKSAMEALEALPVKTAGGSTFFIACIDTTFFGGNGEENELNADRMARIALLEKKLGCEFYIRKETPEQLIEGITESLRSGEPYADVLVIPAKYMGTLIYNDLLTPLQTVSGLDLSAEYFDKKSLETFTVKGNIYGVTGDGLFLPEQFPCLIYNNDLAKANGINSIDELVLNDLWTVDRFNEILSSVTDESITKLSVPQNSEETFLLGSGITYTSHKDGVPVLNTFTDEFSAISSKLSSLLSHSSAQTDFSENKTLFALTTLSELQKYKDTEFVWSTAPLPKASQDGEYFSPMSENSLVLCIPKKVYDAEYSADFIEAFNLSSKDYMVNRYISSSANHVLRNENSVLSLYKILGATNYDLSVAIRNEYTTLSEYTVNIFKKMLDNSITDEELNELKTDSDEYMEKHFALTPVEEE